MKHETASRVAFEVNGRHFRAISNPTEDNSPILRALSKRKAERTLLKAALIKSASVMEDAVCCALEYIDVGSPVPEWLVRLDRAAKQARAAII